MASGDLISRNTVQKAVNALLKWKKLQTNNQKPQLIEEQDDFMYLLLTLKKIPSKARTNPYKIPLPHPLLEDSFSELCLIIADHPKSKKSSKMTSEVAKKKIKSEDIPVTKVLKLSKLKSDYQSFESKRKLCDSYDMFFADKRIVHLLPKLLGKQFFKKKKKVPVPVDLTHNNWKEQFENACSLALLFISTGTCSMIRVGKVSMESEAIVENVVAAIDGAFEVVPKKWVGVRSFQLKFSDSLALPIYQALPDMKLKIEGMKDREEGIKEEGIGQREKKNDDLGKEIGLKKGRIHKVSYMDTNA